LAKANPVEPDHWQRYRYPRLKELRIATPLCCSLNEPSPSAGSATPSDLPSERQEAQTSNPGQIRKLNFHTLTPQCLDPLLLRSASICLLDNPPTTAPPGMAGHHAGNPRKVSCSQAIQGTIDRMLLTISDA